MICQSMEQRAHYSAWLQKHLKVPRPSRSELVRQIVGAEAVASADSVSIDVCALSADEGQDPHDHSIEVGAQSSSQAHGCQARNAAQTVVDVTHSSCEECC